MKLQYGEPLSNFAFNFNLRCYNEAKRDAEKDAEEASRAKLMVEVAGAYTRPLFSST